MPMFDVFWNSASCVEHVLCVEPKQTKHTNTRTKEKASNPESAENVFRTAMHRHDGWHACVFLSGMSVLFGFCCSTAVVQ